MTAVLVLSVGAALLCVGLFLLFGPWALVASGVVVMIAGLIAPWEELTHAKPAQPSPRR